MRASADPILVKRLSVFASAASVFSVVVGLSGLAGWKFHVLALTTWGADPVTMKGNTAFGFVLVGVSLWLLRKKGAPSVAWLRQAAGKGVAAFAGLLGALSLVEAIFRWNLGIDQLLTAAPSGLQADSPAPGLMSPITAGAFFLLSLALVGIDWRNTRGQWPAQFLSLGAGAGATLSLFAFAFDPRAYAAHISLALPTAVAFLAVSWGLICSRTEWGLGMLLSSRSLSGSIARRLLPASFIPAAVGWLRWQIAAGGIYSEWNAVVLVSLIALALMIAIVVWASSAVGRYDVERKRIEQALNASEEQLERLLGRIEEPKSEKRLRRKVEAGFVVAVFLTVFLGVLSWHNARQAAEDAAWIAHTHEVSTALELALRHMLDVQSGSRGFALTGDELFLEPYTAGQSAVGHDLQSLRLLSADNARQQGRLELLARQANDGMECWRNVVAVRRKTGKLPAESDFWLGNQIAEAARDTVQEMENEEKRLLAQRSERARSAQGLTSSAIALGSVLGAVFLTIAGFTVSREIGVSARARGQIAALNADLERRVAERTAALGESESRLAGIIQSAMDAIITTDEQLRVLVFNAAAEKMFRCSAAEALGQPITRFIPERYRAAHDGHQKRFGESGTTTRAMGALGALWGVRADGEEFRIEASISHIQGGGRKLFTVILRDITDWLHAQAIREHLAAVVDSSDDAIISEDRNGIINAWNRGAEKIFGYAASEVIGKPMLMLFPPERVKEEADILARIERGESVEHFETVGVRKDGAQIDVSVTISLIRDGNGVIVGASKIARDITERKQAEERLRKSEENYRLLWDSMDEAFCAIEVLFDQDDKPVDYRFLEVNPAFAKQTGMDNAQGKRIRELQPQQEEYWYQIFGQVARTGRAVRFENEAAQLHRWFEVHAFRVGDPHENKVAILFNDITERKRADQALSESHARLKKVLEVETVGVMFWDLTAGALMDANDTFLNLMGYSRREVEARELSWQKLTPLEYQEVSRAELRKLAVTGRVGPYEKEYFRKDGTRQWLVLAGSSLGDNTCVEFCVDISDRKKAEAALRESENRFRTLIEQASDAFFLHDDNGRFLEVNRQACESLGYTREELLGMCVFDVEQEMDIRTAQRAWEQVEPGKAYTLPGRQRRKDGTTFPVEVRLSAYYVEGKKLHLGLARDTTERKHAEEARERLAAIVDCSEDAIISKNLDGTINAWNRGAEKLFGYSSIEAMGKSMLMLFPPDRVKEETEILARLGRGESIEHFETVRVRKDGESIDVSVTISPIRDSSGAIVGASKIARDITERKRVQQALCESEERLRLFVEHAPAALAMFDREMRYLQWSRRWQSDYGIGDRAVRGISHYELFPEIPERWKEIHRRALAGEVLAADEDRLERADGSVLWIKWEIRPWYDAMGEIGGIVIFAEDITTRREAEERLAAQAEELSRQTEELLRSRQELETQTLLLRSVLDSMTEGLVVADAQGRFILWNPAARKIVGMGAADIAPSEWSRHYGVFMPDTVTPFPPEKNPLALAIAGAASTAVQFVRNPELDEGVWIEISASPLRDSKGATCGGVGAFRDITQRRRDEEEIRKLNEELEERVVQRTAELKAANRELEAFTYSVSHDLRAPLRHIGGFSRILMEDFGPELAPEARGHLQRIEDGTRRMGQLVDELLNLARVGRHALRVQSSELNLIVEEVVSLLQPEAGSRAVSWKIAKLPTVKCDPILIKQVFQNLISNALKFTRPRERAVIEIDSRQQNGELVLFVRDNGVGFDMKYMDKLFGVFQRLHRAEDFEGTGIGLATVQRIVHKHGGQIWAEAEPDKGATFCFSLPPAESIAANSDGLGMAEARLEDAPRNGAAQEGVAAGGSL